VSTPDLYSLHLVEATMKPTRDEQAFAELLEGLRHDAPGEAAKFARLAKALDQVRPSEGPASHFRNNLRNRLIAEAAIKRSWVDVAAEKWTEKNLRLRRSFRFVFVTGIAAAMLLAGGVLFASAQGAVPGDWNYFAKRARESAQLAITRAPAPRAYLQMDFARERLNEVRTLVNRGQTNEGPYFTALNDMDARTLDATRLLIGVYGHSHKSLGLDRLAQFAVAQRHGLEVLVDRLPPGARPAGEDSIDILQRVTDRVTGIIGGCLCPANALLPRVSSGTTTPSTGTSAEAPACPCSQFRGEDTTTQAIDDNGSTTPPTTPSPPPSSPDPKKSPSAVDDVTNTVNDTSGSVNDTVNDLIDGALNDLNETPLDPIVPDASPLPSLPQIHL
jgi:uncharacterized protein DUF5667